MADSKASKDLVVPESGGALATYPILGGGESDIMEAVEANLGGQGIAPFDLDRIGVPTGGSTMWQIPTLEGPEDVREIEGIIVAWQAPRVFWEQNLDETGGGQPPDCSSPDGQYGIGRFQPGSDGNPTGACAVCPMAQWNSALDGGRGKACRELRQLYMIRPGGVLPVVISCPPTSIVPLRKYFMRLASESLPYYGVVTGLRLEQQQNGAYRWSTVEPRLIQRLTLEEAEAAKQYGKNLADQLPRSSATSPVTLADE